MLPRKGAYYGDASHKRLLVIGESHYLPRESTCHRDDLSWYSLKEESLSETERGWISTSRIIDESQAEGFKNKAHGIYRRVAQQLNASGLNLADWRQGIEHCTFYNFFQRPAQDSGGSIAATEMDKTMAQQVFEWVLADVDPELVVVVSRKAGVYVASLLEKKGLPFAITPHPTCRWWNRRSAAYQGLKGCEIIPTFLLEQHWLRAP